LKGAAWISNGRAGAICMIRVEVKLKRVRKRIAVNLSANYP
jgi:hypothetical protein